MRGRRRRLVAREVLDHLDPDLDELQELLEEVCSSLGPIRRRPPLTGFSRRGAAMASFVLRAGERARIRLGVRQKCPDLPNLRNHGLTCVRELLRLVGNLEKRCGYALVSEDSLRAMFFQDTGHMPGVGTLSAAMRREEERHGLFQVRWIQRGSIMPDGRMASVGMLRIRRGRDRNDRRRIRKEAMDLDRRENVGGESCAPVGHAQVMEELRERYELDEQAREASAAEAKAAADEFLRLYPLRAPPS